MDDIWMLRVMGWKTIHFVGVCLQRCLWMWAPRPPQREDKGPEKMNCPTPTISISRTIRVTIDVRVTVSRPDLRVRFRKRGPGGVSFSPTLPGSSDVPESRAPSSLCPVHTDHPKIIKMRILIQEAWGGA